MVVGAERLEGGELRVGDRIGSVDRVIDPLERVPVITPVVWSTVAVVTVFDAMSFWNWL